MTAPDFDVCGPLPQGVSVLESSAGTGKTFTIAALAARYVAEGVPLDRMLLVTFTRTATSELRERVRERLVSAEALLAGSLAGLTLPGPGQAGHGSVAALLAAGSPEEVSVRRARLAAAVAEFDGATIATTHQFCNRMLAGLGVVGDIEPGVRFVDDITDLVDEVVSDLYIRKFAGRSNPDFDFPSAREVARMVVRNWADPLVPPAEGDSRPSLRRRLADRVRVVVEERKREAKILTYDDQIRRLRDTLTDPEVGAEAAARLARRYQVVLVDEFQDTDPLQWEILRRAFVTSGVTLVLIGDPKQAIYGFRGADVYAYLNAARSAAQATLAVNWRSDQRLVTAHHALFGGTHLGHPGIAYQEVRAADPHQSSGMVGAHDDSPLRLRVVHRDHGMVGLTKTGLVEKHSGMAHVAGDVALDMVDLLESGARLVRGHERPLTPGDVAVLVRTRHQANLVSEALGRVGVPAVITGAGSVFETGVATDWLRLLEALDRPSDTSRARMVALSSFVGWSASEVDSADESRLGTLHDRLHRWNHLLRRRGVASLVDSVLRTDGLVARLLSDADGERVLTDLRHIGHLLHVEGGGEAGPAVLAAWLKERIAESTEEIGSDDRTRRLESDGSAVQILTVHRSKGLEFPVVYCPFLYLAQYSNSDKSPPVVFHDGEQRTVHVGLQGRDYEEARSAAQTETVAEELRLAYVAITRARHQVVLWWAHAFLPEESPLGQLLFGRQPGGDIEPGVLVPDDGDVAAHVAALAVHAGAEVSVKPTGDPVATTRRYRTPAPAPADLGVRLFDRTIDSAWRRTSYSGITAAAHEATYGAATAADVDAAPEAPADRPVGSESDAPVTDDEAVVAAAAGPATPSDDEGRLRSAPLLLDGLPGGTRTGSLVHEILEHTDFADPDLAASLAQTVAARWGGWGVDPAAQELTVAGLRAFVETPLGPLAGGARLADVGRADRLDELVFEIPLAGGDDPVPGLTVGAIGALLRRSVPEGDPLAPYGGMVEDDPLLTADLRGFLGGSIDLVLRLAGPGGEPRFFVVDYKTNWLSGDEEPSAWHYRPEAMAEAMMHAHYPLQALLYAVALHRYLRWRLPGYDPATHLGGMMYLFVRGMVGPATPDVDGHPCGVFAWPFPEGLVPDLSDLLDRGPA